MTLLKSRRARRRRASAGEQAVVRIATLGLEDPFGALAQLAACLAELDSVRDMGLAASLEVVERIDHAARTHYREATRRYLHEHASLRGDSFSRSSSAAAEECLTRVAQRYQSHVVLWRTLALKQALPTALLVRSMAGGVRACAAVLKWGYLLRTVCRVGVWADMCTLYGAAEAAACTRTSVEWTQQPGETSVEREFLKGCMLAAGARETMAPSQVDLVERLAGYCAGDLGLAPGADARYAWFVDLESGEPPRPLDPSAPLPIRARSFGIASDERFRRLLHLVETDRLRPAAFGADLDKSAILQTLRQLARSWLRADPAREPLAA
jgi:hypothetical protein